MDTVILARLSRQAPRLVLAAALAVGATACAPAISGRAHEVRNRARPSTIVKGDGECATAALKISFINNQDAAGHAYDDLEFSNISHATCFVEGWPDVSYARTAGGLPAGAPAHRAPGRRRKVVLVAGAAARALLTFADNASDTPHVCGASVGADWLRIYPPGQHRPTFVALGFSIPACSHAQFWIGAVEPRPGHWPA
jgi:hypothetical protein